MLVNSEEVSFNNTSKKFVTLSKANIYWLNANPKTPSQTIFTY